MLVVNKYGIENLKLIIKTLLNTGKLIQKASNLPEPPRKAIGKIIYWLKSFFSNKTEIIVLSNDIYFIAKNAEKLKEEFLDLNGEESKELINYIFANFGAKNPSKILQSIPVLIDAVKALVEIYK